jgi:hypothetical protein
MKRFIMATVQTETKPSDTVILVSQYANHRIIGKEDGVDGKQKVLYDLKFRNGRLVMPRKAYEKLLKIPAFEARVGYGKNIGVLGETKIQPGTVAIPTVVQNAGTKQTEE